MAHVPLAADVSSGRGLASRAALWLPPLAYMALVFALSSQARIPVPEKLPDAALHVPEFFVLGLLLARAFSGTLASRTRALAVAFLTTTVYGLLDELHQSFVPGRVASLADAAADATGALLAVGLAALLARARGAAPVDPTEHPSVPGAP